MKICWDTLERVKFTKNGNFRIGKNTYVEMDVCEACGEFYLTPKNNVGPFCESSCASSGKNNPNYGKKHTIRSRKKMSENKEDCKGVLNPNYKGGGG